jgi:hypothetical protein
VSAWADGPPLSDASIRHAELYRAARHHCDEHALPAAVAHAYANHVADTYTPEAWSPDHRTELPMWLRLNRKDPA